MFMKSRRRSPSLKAEVFGWILGLAVTGLVTLVLWVSVIQWMAATGMIRGPSDPGPATTVEAWFVHNWPIVFLVELVVGALVAMRVCRPIFRSRPARLLTN
jgi:hypothetical protein